MFLLLVRPSEVGCLVDIAGESEARVKDVSTMVTIVVGKDCVEVLVLSSTIIGQKS